MITGMCFKYEFRPHDKLYKWMANSTLFKLRIIENSVFQIGILGGIQNINIVLSI